MNFKTFSTSSSLIPIELDPSSSFDLIISINSLIFSKDSNYSSAVFLASLTTLLTASVGAFPMFLMLSIDSFFSLFNSDAALSTVPMA